MHTKFMGVFLILWCFPAPGRMWRGDWQSSGDCTVREAVSLPWHLQGHKMNVIVSMEALINVLSARQNPSGTEKRDLETAHGKGNTGWQLEREKIHSTVDLVCTRVAHIHYLYPAKECEIVRAARLTQPGHHFYRHCISGIYWILS